MRVLRTSVQTKLGQSSESEEYCGCYAFITPVCAVEFILEDMEIGGSFGRCIED